jgi:hypothetical protein
MVSDTTPLQNAELLALTDRRVLLERMRDRMGEDAGHFLGTAYG